MTTYCRPIQRILPSRMARK